MTYRPYYYRWNRKLREAAQVEYLFLENLKNQISEFKSLHAATEERVKSQKIINRQSVDVIKAMKKKMSQEGNGDGENVPTSEEVNTINETHTEHTNFLNNKGQEEEERKGERERGDTKESFRERGDTHFTIDTFQGMYVYIYVCMYIHTQCMYIYIYIHKRAQIYIYRYIYV